MRKMEFICEYCRKEFEYFKPRRFCNFMCQRKHYNRRPEIREKYRLRMKNYRKDNPVWREYHRQQQARHKEGRKLYRKRYYSRPEVKAMLNKKEKWKNKNIPEYNIAARLRKALRHALVKYSNSGKVKNSRKYGIDWKETIDYLKPFPKNIRKYEIDHIIPLHTFDLNDPKQIRKAFAPTNLQWLTIRENRIKGGKI